MLKVVEKLIGGDVERIEAAIAIDERIAREAKAEIAKLERDVLEADSFQAASAARQKIPELEWTIEKAEHDLERKRAQLANAMMARKSQAFEAHQKRRREIGRRLKKAIDAAVIVQLEAIEADEAARGELGEGLASRIPRVAYLGILLPDLVEVWARELARQFDGSGSAPQRVGRLKSPAEIHRELTRIFGSSRSYKTPEPDKKSDPIAPAPVSNVRPLRDDPWPDDPAKRLVVMRRSGVDLDGMQLIRGDRVVVDAAMARSLVQNAAADFVARDSEKVTS